MTNEMVATTLPGLIQTPYIFLKRCIKILDVEKKLTLLSEQEVGKWGVGGEET